MNIITIVMIAASLALPAGMTSPDRSMKTSIGPTAENALAAEQEINRAMLANDADALSRLLADDWIVINTYGGIAERAPFLAAMKAGQLVRKTMDLSDPRVKIYGNTAVITTQLKTSGTVGGRAFDVSERQTDMLVWSDGAWKSVLLHETAIRK